MRIGNENDQTHPCEKIAEVTDRVWLRLAVIVKGSLVVWRLDSGLGIGFASQTGLLRPRLQGWGGRLARCFFRFSVAKRDILNRRTRLLLLTLTPQHHWSRRLVID